MVVLLRWDTRWVFSIWDEGLPVGMVCQPEFGWDVRLGLLDGIELCCHYGVKNCGGVMYYYGSRFGRLQDFEECFLGCGFVFGVVTLSYEV